MEFIPASVLNLLLILSGFLSEICLHPMAEGSLSIAFQDACNLFLDLPSFCLWIYPHSIHGSISFLFFFFLELSYFYFWSTYIIVYLSGSYTGEYMDFLPGSTCLFLLDLCGLHSWVYLDFSFTFWWNSFLPQTGFYSVIHVHFIPVLLCIFFLELCALASWMPGIYSCIYLHPALISVYMELQL